MTLKQLGDSLTGHYSSQVLGEAELKGTVEFVFKQLLGDEVKLRFRPHYFSYTEPSRSKLRGRIPHF